MINFSLWTTLKSGAKIGRYMYIILCGSTFIPNKILITVYFFSSKTVLSCKSTTNHKWKYGRKPVSFDREQKDILMFFCSC